MNVLKGVPQGSILGPALINIFLNNIFLTLNDSDLHNFPDDTTLFGVSETIQGLVDIMQDKAESAISWVEENDMIANPDKFDEELQKLLSFHRALNLLNNDIYIAKIVQAVLELLRSKAASGNPHRSRKLLFSNFAKSPWVSVTLIS